MLMNAGLTSAIADSHEMAEALNDKQLLDDVLAGKKIDDAKKMMEITKTLDVIMGNTLYAHSYLEMSCDLRYLTAVSIIFYWRF
jgi:hypothetical protein